MSLIAQMTETLAKVSALRRVEPLEAGLQHRLVDPELLGHGGRVGRPRHRLAQLPNIDQTTRRFSFDDNLFAIHHVRRNWPSFEVAKFVFQGAPAFGLGLPTRHHQETVLVGTEA